MAITATPYGAFLTDLGLGVHNFDTDTDNVVLLGNTYAPDFDNHNDYGDIKTYEIGASGTGYTTGGLTLANKDYIYDPNNNVATLNADPVSISTFTGTVRYAAVCKSSTTDALSRLIGLINFGEDRAYSAELFTLSFPNGVISVQSA